MSIGRKHRPTLYLQHGKLKTPYVFGTNLVARELRRVRENSEFMRKRDSYKEHGIGEERKSRPDGLRMEYLNNNVKKSGPFRPSS
jgi:hypothetical protein